MSEESINIENQKIQYIAAVTEPFGKKTIWEKGLLTITENELKIISETTKKEVMTIAINQITEIDKKINLGKLAISAGRVVSIYHTNDGKDLITLISTNKELAITSIKHIINKTLNGKNIEFVCPFSQGGKIFLDKQPVRGTLEIKEDTLYLTSEWLGKKQNEIINIAKINDFEVNMAETGICSITFKYQKDGILISTLINSEHNVISKLDKYVKIFKGFSEEEEKEIQLDEQQFMLLQMMYTSDIDAQMVIETIGITMQELDDMVQKLIRLNLLKISAEDEVELTEKATRYIVEQMKKNVGGA